MFAETENGGEGSAQVRPGDQEPVGRGEPVEPAEENSEPASSLMPDVAGEAGETGDVVADATQEPEKDRNAETAEEQASETQTIQYFVKPNDGKTEVVAES
jgi:hypothetical protein